MTLLTGYAAAATGGSEDEFGVGGVGETEYRHLNVADASTRLPIPVAGVGTVDDDYLQAMAVCKPPLKFFDITDGYLSSPGDKTKAFICQRRNTVLVDATFSAQPSSLVLRPIYVDINNRITFGPTFQLDALTVQDEASRYMTTMASLETYGAKNILVEVISISAGDAEIWMAGV